MFANNLKAFKIRETAAVAQQNSYYIFCSSLRGEQRESENRVFRAGIQLLLFLFSRARGAHYVLAEFTEDNRCILCKAFEDDGASHSQLKGRNKGCRKTIDTAAPPLFSLIPSYIIKTTAAALFPGQ